MEEMLQQPPTVRRTSSLGNEGRGGVSSGLELRLPRTLSDSFDNPLSAWKEDRHRARSRRRIKRTRTSVSCPEEKKDEEVEADDECTGSTTDLEPGSRAWKSGSMLVRPKGDNGCEQVSDRPTYIYLIGKESIPVELIVGPLGSQLDGKEEKDQVERMLLSPGTRACIPEYTTYRLKNMSEEVTAVLYWASLNEGKPSPSSSDEDASMQRVSSTQEAS